MNCTSAVLVAYRGYTVAGYLFQIFSPLGSLGSEDRLQFLLVSPVASYVLRVQFLLEPAHRAGATYFFNDVSFGAWCVSLPRDADLAIWSTKDDGDGFTVASGIDSYFKEVQALFPPVIEVGVVINPHGSFALVTGEIAHASKSTTFI